MAQYHRDDPTLSTTEGFNTMNKIIATLIAGLFATSVFAAQTAPATTSADAKATKEVTKADAKET